jgi:hypothetical protein
LEHGLNVTRDQVYDVMSELDPQGLEARDPKAKFLLAVVQWYTVCT